MFLSSLPPELQHEILMHLDGISLAKAECVCKIWYDILTTSLFNLIWRRECLYDIEESVLVQLTGMEDILVAELRYSATSPKYDVKTDTRVWKAVYKKWHTCKKVGHWPVIKSEIRANKAGVHHIQVSGDIIFTAHLDKIIRLWDSWTGACLKTLSGHHKAVLCIALYHRPVNTLGKEQCLPELIASGSDDREVRIWNVETGSCQAIFSDHNDAVKCLAISKEHVISASYDGSMHLWDLFKNTVCMNIKRAHFNPILHLSVWKRMAVSVAQDKIKFWSLETGVCLHFVKNNDMVHTSCSVDCVLRNYHTILVKTDGELSLWDFNRSDSPEDEPALRYSLLNYRTTQGSSISCFTTYGNLLAVGTEAGMIFLFHYDRDWSEQLTKIHFQVNTGCSGLCCMTLSHDGEGPLLVAGHNGGLIKIFRWFSPSIS